MSTRFIFVRHAISEAKERGIVQGTGLHIPLSATGKKQALLLANALKAYCFDRIVSSKALRARETAEQIRSFHPNVPYEETDVLNERSKGEGEGMLYYDFAKKYPWLISAWSKEEEDPRPIGGENFADVESRVIPLIRKHADSYPNQTILYIGHGNVFRVIIGVILGVPLKFCSRIRQDYCAVSSIEFNDHEDRWSVITLNQKVLDLL